MNLLSLIDSHIITSLHVFFFNKLKEFSELDFCVTRQIYIKPFKMKVSNTFAELRRRKCRELRIVGENLVIITKSR